MPADGADLSLEPADAGFARIPLDDLLDAVLREVEPLVGETVGAQLLGTEELARDGELLGPRVARALDDLHAVHQGRGDHLRIVGGAEEGDLGEVVRDVEVVVLEGRVLLRVEHFEERGGGIAEEVDAHLVDLVEHEDGVLHGRALHRLHDAARERAHVGAAVASDLGFVADAAERDAVVAATHRPRDRTAERSLPDAGRP